YPSIVASTWALATELAEQIPPAGLARPILALAAMLDPNGIPGTVLTSQAAVQQNLTAAESDEAARAAAEALFQVWPRTPVPASFEQALRDSTARLQAAAGRVLWTPESHPVLLRAGRSLESAGLTEAATGYWQSMLETSQAELGPNHAQTFLARDRLGAANEAAGRSNDAVEVYQESLDERQRILGAGHPDTVTAR